MIINNLYYNIYIYTGLIIYTGNITVNIEVGNRRKGKARIIITMIIITVLTTTNV